MWCSDFAMLSIDFSFWGIWLVNRLKLLTSHLCEAIVSQCRIWRNFRLKFFKMLVIYHPRKPRGGQSGREKWREESFQVRVKELLGTDSHQTFLKRSSECWLLIGQKNALYYCDQSANSISWVLFFLCPIRSQHSLDRQYPGALPPVLERQVAYLALHAACLGWP